MLGDGTSVCLNSESELRYPVQFVAGSDGCFYVEKGI